MYRYIQLINNLFNLILFLINEVSRTKRVQAKGNVIKKQKTPIFYAN